MTEHLVIITLLSFLVVIAIGIIVLRDLLAAVILLGLYSLVAAGAFVVMDAVDVAFTEAAVGAGISTILFLGALSFTSHEQKPRGNDSVLAGVFVVVTGGLLIYGTLDMPHYGSATSPAQTHPELAVRFIERSAGEVGPPNVVTSVLASYRGYDTLGETVVVFAAGIAVLSLLGLRRRPSGADAPADAPGDRPAGSDDRPPGAGSGADGGPTAVAAASGPSPPEPMPSDAREAKRGARTEGRGKRKAGGPGEPRSTGSPGPGKAGSGKAGSDKAGPSKAGSGSPGSDKAGTGKAETARSGSGRPGSGKSGSGKGKGRRGAKR